MDWIKKNMALVIGGAVALVAVGVAGYYLFVQMGKYEEAGAQLTSVANTVTGFVTKNPHPGAGDVDNIKLVKADIERLESFKKELTGTFKATPLGGQTEQAFKAELADILAYIAREGKRTGVTAPTNFNLSFTAQKIGFRFASNSLGPLSVQLADLREITRILVEARVNSIESYRRVAVSDDDKGPNAAEADYITNLKITTNEFTGAIVHPYEVTFRSFSEEFGRVLEGIARSPYSIILKTVSVEPAEVRKIRPQFTMGDDMFGLPFGGAPPPASRYGEARGGALTSRYGGASARNDAQTSSRYGGAATGRTDAQTSSRYGGPAAGRTAVAAPSVYGAPPVAALPSGPETILTEEPLKVTLGLAVIRMPEPPAANPATN